MDILQVCFVEACSLFLFLWGFTRNLQGLRGASCLFFGRVQRARVCGPARLLLWLGFIETENWKLNPSSTVSFKIPPRAF